KLLVMTRGLHRERLAADREAPVCVPLRLSGRDDSGVSSTFCAGPEHGLHTREGKRTPNAGYIRLPEHVGRSGQSAIGSRCSTVVDSTDKTVHHLVVGHN